MGICACRNSRLFERIQRRRDRSGKVEFAAFVETIQGQAAMVPPVNFRELKKVLDQHGILIVVDEIGWASPHGQNVGDRHLAWARYSRVRKAIITASIAFGDLVGGLDPSGDLSAQLDPFHLRQQSDGHGNRARNPQNA